MALDSLPSQLRAVLPNVITFHPDPIREKIISLTKSYCHYIAPDFAKFFSRLANEPVLDMQEAAKILKNFACSYPFSQSNARVSRVVAWVLHEVAEIEDHHLVVKRGLGLLLDYCRFEEGWLGELFPKKQSQKTTECIYQNLLMLDETHCKKTTLDRIKKISERLKQVAAISTHSSQFLPYAMLIEMKLVPDEDKKAIYPCDVFGLDMIFIYNRANKSVVVPVQAPSRKGGSKRVLKTISLSETRSQPYCFKALLENKGSRIEHYAEEYELHLELTAKKIVGIWPLDFHVTLPWSSHGKYLPAIFAVMDWAEGTLEDFMGRDQRCSIEKIITIARQLAEAFAYLHGINLLHGDLKLTNVLCDYKENDFVLGLSDFGNAFYKKDIKDSSLARVGFYGSVTCSPFEYLGAADTSLDPSPAEMWAFGFLLLQLYYGKNPAWATILNDCWDEKKFEDPMPVTEQGRQRLMRHYEKEITRPKRDLVSLDSKSNKDHLKLLIYDLLDLNREKRPTAEEALVRLKALPVSLQVSGLTS